MKTLISRVTMRRIGFLFIDKVVGKEVYLYQDKYGKKWMANYPFFCWGFRVEQGGNK